jgi:diguanylate cyclase (GGDEF)-like protein
VGSDSEQQRVLVAAREMERVQLLTLFNRGDISGWQAEEADSWERLHFLVQLDPPEVLLIDANLLCQEEPGERSTPPIPLRWPVPTVFLTPEDPHLILEALSHGAYQWLPRELALEHPPLLAVALLRAHHWNLLRAQTEAVSSALFESQRKIHHLVELLWETSPSHGPTPWFSQRHMLERLEEELDRAHRHGGPLTVLLLDIQPAEGLPGNPPVEWSREQRNWIAEFLAQNKRRSDIVGQYGLSELLLILPRVDDWEATLFGQRLKKMLEHPEQAIPFDSLRVCFGVANWTPLHATVQSLLSRAEANLAQARHPQRNLILHPFNLEGPHRLGNLVMSQGIKKKG